MHVSTMQVCVITGCLASITSLLSYGSSTSYLGAILSRTLPALFIGSPVGLKSMMGDVCDQAGQAKAMAIFSLGHGMGSVVGTMHFSSHVSQATACLPALRS